MYVSYHDKFTTQTLHRTTNNSRLAQTKVSFNKKQRVNFARIIGLVSLFSLLILFGAIVHAYAAQEPHADQVTSIPSKNAAVQETGTLIQHSIVVYSGDTLWSIAEEHAPSRMDKRVYIKKIMKINGLSSTLLYEGQVLQLP